jgi:dolichol-phosphate mannosyltransferase
LGSAAHPNGNRGNRDRQMDPRPTQTEARAALSPDPTKGPAVSVVVPCRDEAENLPGLIDEIAGALRAVAFEVIVVDDGSRDGTPAVLADLIETRPWLRPISHDLSAGQSAAIRSGLLAAKGAVVVTIDGDGQNNPAFIPVLLSALETGASVALAAGQRVQRAATGPKRLASRMANGLRGFVLKDRTRDTGCGLKALRRDVFLLLPYFDGWHRYLPALVLREGGEIVHVDVVDRQRRFGQSKYGILDRALVGALDLVGVWWLRRRRRRIPVVTEIARR